MTEKTSGETTTTRAVRGFPLWLPALLLAAFATSAVIWSLHAPRYYFFNAESYGSHWEHRFWMFMHVIPATIALVVGPWMLWSGLRQRKLWLHQWIGRVYLVFGSIGVVGGTIISTLFPHEPKGVFTATFTLGLVWLAVAFLGYRAIRRYRTETHRDLMIISYVLTFTFVSCRIVGRLPLLESLGPDKDTALVWLGWVIPFTLTLLILHVRGPKPLSE